MQSIDERFTTKDEVVSLKYGTGFKPSDWFNHDAITLDVKISPSQAARSLLSVLTFGFGGLSGVKGISHLDAICTKGVVFVVHGDTLKNTLLLNLNQYTHDPLASNQDIPGWEMDDWFDLERPTPFGLLDQYTFPSRRIKLYLDPIQLEQDSLLVSQYRLGLGLGDKGLILDPMKHYYESKTSGLLPLSFDEDRQLWRNSSSLFEAEPKGKKPPLIFTWLNTLVAEEILNRDMVIQYKALGMAKNKGRADFSRQEQFPLPLSLLSDEQKLAQLKDAIDSVGRTNRVLTRNLAITGMYLYIDDPTAFNWAKKGITHAGAEKDLSKIKTTEAEISNWMDYTGVERHFWATLDVPFLAFMEKLGNADEDNLIPVKIWWQGQIRESAQSAFRRVLQYTNQTPRAYKAFAHGNNRLQSYLNKNYSHKEVIA